MTRADVRLVDAQAEGVRGDEAVQLAAHESVLDHGAALRGHPAVVAGGDDLLLGEEVGQLLDGLDRGAVDDRGALGLGEQFEELGPLLVVAGHAGATESVMFGR